MATTNVRNDLIPLKSGIVRLIPLDANGDPIYKAAITTQRNFLTSTQVTTTRASETLPNGNGSDKDYPTDEKFNLALVTQIYDPKFHNTLAGSVTAGAVLPIPYDTTITVTNNADAYEVDLTEKEPAASPDGKYYFEIRDSYGNLLEQVDTTVAEGKFKYDSDTKKLSFDASAENKSYSCVYYVAATGGEAYESNPILSNPQFMIEVYGEMQSANYGGTVLLHERMLRATVSGDLPNVTSQKSISAPITYNFASAPVPQGKSAFYQAFVPQAQ